jgi:hypothetical protein
MIYDYSAQLFAWFLGGSIYNAHDMRLFPIPYTLAYCFRDGVKKIK